MLSSNQNASAVKYHYLLLILTLFSNSIQSNHLYIITDLISYVKKFHFIIFMKNINDFFFSI